MWAQGKKHLQLFADKKKCFGGVARLKKAVDDLKKEHENVIFVNAGDFYQGTVLYTKFKWEIAVEFENMLNFTAMVRAQNTFHINPQLF